MTHDSINDARSELDTLVALASFSRNMLSITVDSVGDEPIPIKAHQSLTTQPAATILLPRFTVPAYKKHKTNSILKSMLSF